MAAILPGYEYDIFISYRQNDNRSGWVSEFVKDLREELASTVKFPVSIYFDANPHDGLLETHSVDRTLEGKLKCLVFIPVLSQTYCDLTSFAWNSEFLAFRDQARIDQTSLNIKLSNGNIASRILPVRIHDLDPADQKRFEYESGGAIRGVDFVFRAPGVNRPLRSKDDDVKEISHLLFYRDQINKTANAIRDLLIAIETPFTLERAVPESASDKKSSGKPISIVLPIAGFLVIGVGTYFYETLGRPHASSPNVTEVRGLFILGFSVAAIGLFYFFDRWKRRETTAPSTRREIILVLVAALFYLLVGAGIADKWRATIIDKGIPQPPWLFIFFLALGPFLYYWKIPSKRSKVVLTAAMILILAMPLHVASTEYFAMATLLIITSIVYYFTIPARPLKRSKLVLFAWIFSVFAITVYLLFFKDLVAALTILVISGPVFYYFVGHE